MASLLTLCVSVWQGTADNFYKQGQLLPENFEKAVKDAGLKGLTLRFQEARPLHSFCVNPRLNKLTVCLQGYDHSYYFMASFSDEHIDHAAKHLGLD